MGATKKPRRAYRPRAVNNLAHLRPILGHQRMSVDDQARRALQLSMAVDRIVATGGLRPDWNTVFDAVNFIQAFTEMPSVMQGADDFILRVMTTMDDVMTRFRGTDSRAMSAEEVESLHDLSSLWAEVLALVTWREFIDAEAAVNVMVKRALAGEAPPGVRVVEPAPDVLGVRHG